MQYCLFDDYSWEQLLPLTFTRSVADLRIGIDSIAEKWQRILVEKPYILSQDYLQYSRLEEGPCTYINSSIIPNDELLADIKKLKSGEGLNYNSKLIALKPSKTFFNLNELIENNSCQLISYNSPLITIERPWDIFTKNGLVLKQDFVNYTNGRNSAKLSNTNTIIGDNIFVEKGVTAEACIINCSEGPVYLGKGANLMEGSIIRGPLSMGESSTLKLGTKIYGPTTIGPHSKVGGELNNVVIQGFSNKAHDGFLGNSVIGAWCNIGADTNTSNLKNNYAEVRLWSYTEKRFIKTGEQFCGLIMGDHSKCGINTMFNTGTVIGVSANIFGEGFPRNIIPSFAWGGKNGFMTYKYDKAMEVAEIVMGRRGIELDKRERSILKHIFDTSAEYRTWEK